jgi:hypothetical protein
VKHNRCLIIGVGAHLPITVTDANGVTFILSDAARRNFDPANGRGLTEADVTQDAILAALNH